MMEWALSVVTAPTEEPVTLAEAKAHLRVDGSDEDTLISSLIMAARDVCEAHARRAFVTQTLKMSFDGWSSDSYFKLMRPPLASVTHVKYYDSTDTLNTMPSGDYVVDTALGRVWLADDASWPSATLRVGMPVEITYIAGYGNADAVPQRYKQAMLLLIGHWHENREQAVVGSAINQLPFAVETLLKTGRGSW